MIEKVCVRLQVALRRMGRHGVLTWLARGQKGSEVLLYLALWAVLFAIPLLAMSVGDWLASPSRTLSLTPDEWQGVRSAWSLLGMFFGCFLLHNFLVAPLLVYRNRRWLYASLVCLLLVCFTACQYGRRPPRPMPEPGVEGRPSLHMSPPKPHGAMPHRPHGGDHEPPRALGGQDSVAFIIMSLLLALNVGGKYFFKSLDDRKRMRELERENLNRQLEYLKYQINPHFFMNTLNNIHALVDIDPEQAKYTIEVLSKLMRYVLYEGNRAMAPLARELDFIAHYIDLMRIRYTDRVRITVDFPSRPAEVQVPSLLFATFVENAFKHGVSYQRESYVQVALRVDEAAGVVEFVCANSRKPQAEDSHGGVGLQNAVRRLRLIYRDAYDLRVDSDEHEYRLTLRLPVGQAG